MGIHYFVTPSQRLFLTAPTQGTKPFSRPGGNGSGVSAAEIASRGMTRVTLVVVLVVVLAFAGGALFLAYWNFDVPRMAVEKVLPDARFPK